MKTIISVCILSIFLYACSKDTPTPDPIPGCIDEQAFNYDSLATVDDGSCCTIAGCIDSLASNFNQDACYDDSSCTYAFIDCNGVENGLAVLDDCDECHQSYIYNFQTHVPTDINDTTGLVLDPMSEMLILAGSPEDIASNPNWNAGCK
ncbi:hypothetical protein OAK24_00025 [Flavobacteriales bacterium]|nr:hypothetical protein [Flavobacteriales bacterium]